MGENGFGCQFNHPGRIANEPDLAKPKVGETSRFATENTRDLLELRRRFALFDVDGTPNQQPPQKNLWVDFLWFIRPFPHRRVVTVHALKKSISNLVVTFHCSVFVKIR